MISFEKSVFATGGIVDSSDVFESRIVEKSTARVLVDKRQGAKGGNGVMTGKY